MLQINNIVHFCNFAFAQLNAAIRTMNPSYKRKVIRVYKIEIL